MRNTVHDVCSTKINFSDNRAKRRRRRHLLLSSSERADVFLRFICSQALTEWHLFHRHRLIGFRSAVVVTFSPHLVMLQVSRKKIYNGRKLLLNFDGKYVNHFWHDIDRFGIIMHSGSSSTRENWRNITAIEAH